MLDVSELRDFCIEALAWLKKERGDKDRPVVLADTDSESVERLEATLALTARFDLAPPGDVDRQPGVYYAVRPDGVETVVQYPKGAKWFVDWGRFDFCLSLDMAQSDGWRIARAAVIGGDR